jgi:D-3-phosphoglycerate dehydrogenase
MVKILVADKLDQAVIEQARTQPDVEIDVKLGLTEDQLAQEVGKYDGVLIRSGVKITAKILANPGRMKAVARAGVGVDNVDLEAATKSGVLVMNTPDANTIATTEQTFALMLAMMRHTVPAASETKAGKWDRNKFVGFQLAGKTLGIIGLGRIGRAVAERALAFKMKVLAFDPMFPGESAMEGRVALCPDLDAFLKQVDILTIHAGLTDQTRGMIGKEQLAMMKPTARVINCARGGIVDEAALADALANNVIAGAAMDVYTQEPPPADMPLLKQEKLLATCHLGASTKEAQQAVSIEAMACMLDYLMHNTIRGACNVSGLPASISPVQQSYVDLVSRMGTLIGLIGKGSIKSVNISVSSADFESILPLLLRTALVKLMGRFMEQPLVNLVNAEVIAKSTGIETSYAVRTSKYDSPLVRLDIQTEDGPHSIIGSLSSRNVPLIMKVNGHRLQLVPEGCMCVVENVDEPGVIGLVGTTFGKHKVNIADLTLSRHQNKALMVFKIDSPPAQGVIEELKQQSKLIRMVAVTQLPELPEHVKKEEAI